jgi:hypothetical protein
MLAMLAARVPVRVEFFRIGIGVDGAIEVVDLKRQIDRPIIGNLEAPAGERSPDPAESERNQRHMALALENHVRCGRKLRQRLHGQETGGRMLANLRGATRAQLRLLGEPAHRLRHQGVDDEAYLAEIMLASGFAEFEFAPPGGSQMTKVTKISLVLAAVSAWLLSGQPGWTQ